MVGGDQRDHQGDNSPQYGEVEVLSGDRCGSQQGVGSEGQDRRSEGSEAARCDAGFVGFWNCWDFLILIQANNGCDLNFVWILSKYVFF